MFENHFGFIRRPFTAAPDAELYVPNDVVQAARESVRYCLRSGQGMSVVTGATGIGKSMFCQVLMAELRNEFPIAFLPSPGTSSCLGLLQAIYFGLGERVKKKHAGISDSEMRLELLSTVQGLNTPATGIIVLVDEAHLLSTQQLEELRVLSTYHNSGQPLIRTLLCGTSELEELLLETSMRSLNQRIRCQTFLQSLTRAESETFVRKQLERAGAANRTIFEDDAITAIAVAADGNPRCLNQLCDESLYRASQAGSLTVNADLVEEALDELVQLPLNYKRSLSKKSESSVPTPATASVVEFGSLDDDGTSSVSPESAPSPTESAFEAVLADDTLELGSDVEELPDTEILAEDDCPIHESDACAVDASDEGYSVERKEELAESFRRGLPDSPHAQQFVPIADHFARHNPRSAPTLAASETSEPATSPAIEESAGPGPLEPRFVGPTEIEDTALLAEANLGDLEEQFADSGSGAVVDPWSGTEQAVRETILIDEAHLTPEEKLLSSCIDTRKQIASMLDSLESHVSESLSQHYDVVMPEEPVSERIPGDGTRAHNTSSAGETTVGDRLQRAVQYEQDSQLQ